MHVSIPYNINSISVLLEGRSRGKISLLSLKSKTRAAEPHLLPDAAAVCVHVCACRCVCRCARHCEQVHMNTPQDVSLATQQCSCTADTFITTLGYIQNV